MDKFEIKIENEREFAVFENGDKQPIHSDDKYGKYICVRNTLNTDDKKPFNRLFTRRIKDAVETIRNGDGDCIRVNNTFTKIINVIYFLDREVGEKLRQKSIEGWKDAKFGWIVTCGNKTSISGYYPLADNYTLCYPFDDDIKPLVFTEREEAVKYIEKAISIAKEYVVAYENKLKESHVEDRIEVCDNMIYNKIKEDFGKFNVLSHFALDMIDDNMVPKNNYELDEYGYRIEQYCIG